MQTKPAAAWLFNQPFLDSNSPTIEYSKICPTTLQECQCNAQKVALNIIQINSSNSKHGYSGHKPYTCIMFYVLPKSFKFIDETNNYTKHILDTRISYIKFNR